MTQLFNTVITQQFLGLDIVGAGNFIEMLLRFLINSIVVVIVVRLLYFPVARRKDYLFSFTLISTLVFLLCYILESVELQLGFAFGLFAIFGILRYRTNPIPIKEMTYLFVLIGISVINALAGNNIGWVELVFTNLILILIIYALEKLWLQEHGLTKSIIYEKPDMIVPEKRQELIVELEQRTGLKIDRLDIRRIDYRRRRVRIIIFFKDQRKDKGT